PRGAGSISTPPRPAGVVELADRSVVLRDGRKAADESSAGIDQDTLVSYVTGVAAGEAESGRAARATGEVVLEVENLAGEDIEGIDLTVRAGEVVGVAGVLGSGREALPALVFGSRAGSADR